MRTAKRITALAAVAILMVLLSATETVDAPGWFRIGASTIDGPDVIR